jgi:hypothetical protein
LINILREFLEGGVRPPYGKHHIPRIAHKLNKQLNDGTQYTNEQVSKKIGQLRDAHACYTDLRKENFGTGFGWNDDTRMIFATSEQWEYIRTVSLYLYY